MIKNYTHILLLAWLFLMKGICLSSADEAGETNTVQAPPAPPLVLSAPMQSAPHSYSKADTDEFLEKIYAIIDFNSLMNPKFLENILDVKFELFPENYGPAKINNLSDFQFRAGKTKFEEGDGQISINYTVFPSGMYPMGGLYHGETLMATLDIGFDIPSVCIPETAFDQKFDTPRKQNRLGFPQSFDTYQFDRKMIGQDYNEDFAFGVDRQSHCVTWVAMTQGYDHCLPIVPQPGDPGWHDPK